MKLKNIEINPPARSVKQLLAQGFVAIDKPSGPTSHLVADYVKRILKIPKAGHGGTLDPAVTGLLPVALGKATKAIQVFLLGKKAYVGVMQLHKPVSIDNLKMCISEFIGDIVQLPPIKSAVKRVKRVRSVYSFKVLEIKNNLVLFYVSCQAGTYIRKLIHDLGKKLGVGAQMVELRRVLAASFSEVDLVTLHDLADAYYQYKQGNDSLLLDLIKPVEFAVIHLPKVIVQEPVIDAIIHGRSIAVPGIDEFTEFKKGDLVAVFSHEHELLCLGIAQMNFEDALEANKGIVVKTSKVFIG